MVKIIKMDKHFISHKYKILGYSISKFFKSED